MASIFSDSFLDYGLTVPSAAGPVRPPNNPSDLTSLDYMQLASSTLQSIGSTGDDAADTVLQASSTALSFAAAGKIFGATGIGVGVGVSLGILSIITSSNARKAARREAERQRREANRAAGRRVLSHLENFEKQLSSSEKQNRKLLGKLYNSRGEFHKQFSAQAGILYANKFGSKKLIQAAKAKQIEFESALTGTHIAALNAIIRGDIAESFIKQDKAKVKRSIEKGSVDYNLTNADIIGGLT